jgi:hypothetical protein
LGGELLLEQLVLLLESGSVGVAEGGLGLKVELLGRSSDGLASGGVDLLASSRVDLWSSRSRGGGSSSRAEDTEEAAGGAAAGGAAAGGAAAGGAAAGGAAAGGTGAAATGAGGGGGGICALGSISGAPVVGSIGAPVTGSIGAPVAGSTAAPPAGAGAGGGGGGTSSLSESEASESSVPACGSRGARATWLRNSPVSCLGWMLEPVKGSAVPY